MINHVKALGLDLGALPARGQDAPYSSIDKDLDSPTKLRMRSFLDRQKSFGMGGANFDSSADIHPTKQSQLQSMLLGASPRRNNQELSMLQNMINDEEDDRFGNIKMSDEDITPEQRTPGQGFLTGGPRLQVSQRSKGIKKDHPPLAASGRGGFAPHPSLALGHAHSYDPQNITQDLFRQSGEKIQDKGEYYLIHRMNTKTKRLNQILQCKQCPMKFPKLCNLRDHVRIHKEDMPFKCSLCNKAFTQAGNRDRHQSKRVCLRRNNNNSGAEKQEADDDEDAQARDCDDEVGGMDANMQSDEDQQDMQHQESPQNGVGPQVDQY